MESHCKLNDKTGRCVINSDPSVTEDDPMCYKTDKNRCAVKKKKIIKIKPILREKELDVLQEQHQHQHQHQHQYQHKHKWSLKYKRSIDCKHPKGFSQKQHCKYGRKNWKKT